MCSPFAAARSVAPGRFALFDYGFRPFFLGAGVFAIVAQVLWVALLAGGLWPAEGPDPLSWHTHEMLVGFVSAAVAGFLLTAVPNWTSRRGYAGPPLVALFGLWVAGRIALAPGLPVPPVAAAVIDLAFYPALAALVLPAIVGSGNRRNYLFVALLSLLTLADAAFHLDRLGLVPGAWDWGRRLVLDVTLLMVALIGGRIVPSFTSSTLRRLRTPVELTPNRWLERVALGSLLALAVADLADPLGPAAGALAGIAALAHAVRLARWRGWRTLGDPLLWVLHLGYLWVPVGLGLKALWLLGGVAAGQGWMHALTIGAFSTMILAVMTRASLGHTGRALAAPPVVVPAYLLLSLATLARLAAPLLADWGTPALTLAAACWITAFTLFTVAYAPILIGPRPDGRPG